MKIIQVYDVCVYIDGLLIGGAVDGTIAEGVSVSIKDFGLKFYPVYFSYANRIGANAIITYKYKRKGYALNCTLKQTEVCTQDYPGNYLLLNLEFSI